MKNIKKSLLPLTILSTLVSPLTFASEWEFMIEPYMMASTISGDASIGRMEGADVDVNFDDILEVLHTGGMLHFEGIHQSGWGYIFDYGFMDLRDDITGQNGGVTSFKVRQGVVQTEGFYRVYKSSGTLDYSIGLRWWDNDIDASIDHRILPGDANAEVKADWVDWFVGLRWNAPINDQFSYMLRADVGGLGAEADFTGSLAVGIKYQINENMFIDAQYKGTWVDYENGTSGSKGYFAYDTVTHGPILGFIYNF